MLINKYKEKKEIKSSNTFLKEKNLELRKKLKMTKMKFVRLANTIKDIYLIIILFQKRLLQVYRLLRFTRLKEIDENILKQIKSFFKKHIKIIYNILKSTNKVCDFFG